MLKEKRNLKSITVDYEDETITVFYFDKVLRDEVTIATTPAREVFTVADFDRMKQAYPELAGKYGQGVLGWNAAKAKEARALRDGLPPPKASTRKASRKAPAKKRVKK